MTSTLSSHISRSYHRVTTPEYCERLCISWLIPPWILFAYRILVSIYAFAGLLFTIAWRCTQETCVQAERSFSYFTVLGYWGLAFYHAFAAAHTASYALRGAPWLASWLKSLRYLHSVFYATITTFPYIVTGIYWAFLADGAFASPFRTWSNVSEHSLNSVFALIEMLLPMADPHSWLHLAPLIVILACYLAVAYITHAHQGFYVYGFLDPATGRGLVAAYCFGILGATIVAFVLVRYLQLLRQWITETKLGLRGVGTHMETLAEDYRQNLELDEAKP